MFDMVSLEIKLYYSRRRTTQISGLVKADGVTLGSRRHGAERLASTFIERDRVQHVGSTLAATILSHRDSLAAFC
jgi:hypothetical protein